MATFQEFHGISLAPNAFVENLVVERLPQDPLPVEAARVWYNTAEMCYKHSTLTAQGSVVIRSFTTKEALDAAIQAEETRAKAAEQKLTTDLASEVERAISAELSLEQRINALGSAFNYVGSVEGAASAVSALDLNSLAPDQKNAGDYFKVTVSGYFKVGSSQAFYAKSGDGLVWNLNEGIDIIDNTNSEVSGSMNFIKVEGSTDTGFIVDVDPVFKGRVSTLEEGLAQEIIDRTAADSALDQRVLTVEQQTNGKIGNLESLTTDNKSTLVGAINEVDSQLNAEVVRATAAELTLTENLASEVNQRQADVNGIKEAINSSVFRYTSSAPALVHTIQHNMNTQHYLFSIMIQREDGTYVNDLSPIRELSTNALEVRLTSARNLKFTFKDASDMF